MRQQHGFCCTMLGSFGMLRPPHNEGTFDPFSQQPSWVSSDQCQFYSWHTSTLKLWRQFRPRKWVSIQWMSPPSWTQIAVRPALLPQLSNRLAPMLPLHCMTRVVAAGTPLLWRSSHNQSHAFPCPNGLCCMLWGEQIRRLGRGKDIIFSLVSPTIANGSPQTCASFLTRARLRL